MTVDDFKQLLKDRYFDPVSAAYIYDDRFFFLDTCKGKKIGPIKIVSIYKTTRKPDLISKANCLITIDFYHHDKNYRGPAENLLDTTHVSMPHWAWDAESDSWLWKQSVDVYQTTYGATTQSFYFNAQDLAPWEFLDVVLKKVEDTKLGKLIYL